MTTERSLIFTTNNYKDFSKQLVAHLGADLGEFEERVFPDGEIYHRISTPPKGRRTILVGGTVTDADTLALYDMACALVKSGATQLTMVMPFWGYSTMERAVYPGEIVKAKTRARLFSSVPIAPTGNRVVLLDLHAEGIPFYFEGALRPSHASTKTLFVSLARRLGDENFVMGCTDTGRAKWVESLALDLNADTAVILKRRLEDGTVVAGLNADVRDRMVIIYDDMIRTGGSLVNAAEIYRNAGATRVVALCTHGVFPGDALDRIAASGVVESVYATDSHPRARELAGDFLKIEPVAALLAAHVNEAP